MLNLKLPFWVFIVFVVFTVIVIEHWLIALRPKVLIVAYLLSTQGFVHLTPDWALLLFIFLAWAVVSLLVSLAYGKIFRESN